MSNPFFADLPEPTSNDQQKVTILRWVIYLFGSGLTFFVGVACILAAVTLLARQQRRWQQQLAKVMCLLGAIVVALSAAPLPYWLYGIAGITTLTLLIVEQSHRLELCRRRIWLRTIVCVCWLGAMGIELFYQVSPRITRRDSPPIFIIADSVTAGVGDAHVVTWPVLLNQLHPEVKVHNFSRMGATVKSAFTQAERLPSVGGFLLIEIGGNDVLGTTSPADFERDLERLLQRVRADDRTVLMFEVPLPPLCNEFGIIQRRLAAQHAVPLVPKRLLMSVLTGAEATVDSIHLSAVGHQRMEQLVWSFIGPAYPTR